MPVSMTSGFPARSTEAWPAVAQFESTVRRSGVKCGVAAAEVARYVDDHPILTRRGRG